MRLVGVDPAQVLHRRPLELLYPDGSGLRLPRGNVHLAFAWAVLACAAGVGASAGRCCARRCGWLRSGMRNPGVDTVAQLVRRPARPGARRPDRPAVHRRAEHAVGAGQRHGVPARARRCPVRRPGQLGPAAARVPACRACFRSLPAHGSLGRAPTCGWAAACSRSCASRTPRLVRRRRALRHRGARLQRRRGGEADRAVEPGLVGAGRGAALRADCHRVPASARDSRCHRRWWRCAARAEQPAQFAFDLGLLGQHSDLVAFVISGARDWLERGLPALVGVGAAPGRQRLAGLVRRLADGRAHDDGTPRDLCAACPRWRGRRSSIAPGLLAAGDYVEGPYPATIEGAVRAGVRAVSTAMHAS